MGPTAAFCCAAGVRDRGGIEKGSRREKKDALWTWRAGPATKCLTGKPTG